MTINMFVYELRWFPFAALHSVPLPEGAVARALDYASFLALRGLSSPETSRRGNTFGMVGMAIAMLSPWWNRLLMHTLTPWPRSAMPRARCPGSSGAE